MRSTLRSVAVTTAALALATGSTVLASPALAVTVGTCNGTGNVALSPGITVGTPTMTTMFLNGRISGCTGKLPAKGTIKGKATSLAPGLTCTSGSATGKITVTWANGTIDVVKITADTTSGFSGTVTSGPRKGATITLAGTVTPVTGDCLFTPLTKASVSGTVTVSR